MMLRTLPIFLTLTISQQANAALYHPTLQTSLLEHILVDNWGAYASNFSSAITPCDRYVTQTGTAALTSGRTTAAQWMRVMFHDFITANVSAGTGGLDASIGFETAREENKGSAFNDSFTFWRPFVNGAVSMADLIALGTVMSNNLCGGAQMPYRAGRIDALTAGSTTGVPAPETSLEETLTFFERAGFNAQDAIGLTACGHTMGSVHHGGFPDVVDASFVTPNNTNGGSNFDTSRAVFDTKVVGEYVHWTGNKGGPLVTSYNDSMNSDLRLYESDGKEIAAMAVKPVNVTFDFDGEGKLVLSGRMRVLTAAGEERPRSLQLHLSDDEDGLEIAAEVETGQSVFGRGSGGYGVTTYFPFSVSGASTRNVTSFSVSGSGVQQTFPISSQSFVVPSLTSLERTSLNVTVAISASSSCDDLTVHIAAPFPQLGTLAPKMREDHISMSAAEKEFDGYKLCMGTELLDKSPTGLLIVEALIRETIVDSLLVNGGMAGW
ncbi:hypothetical protein P3342_008679 [Pyrenophora teres f. teres]|nr:hypothetical protein P3342_008679 [Pyrenophora teres f. teres]